MELHQDKLKAESQDVQATEWLRLVERNEKRLESTMRRPAREIIARYRSRQDEDDYGSDGQYSFNLHWANTEMLRSAIVAKTPEPVVKRRWKDSNIIGIQTSEILERAIKFSLGEYDFDATLDNAVLDFANAGLGQAVIRYKPYFSQEDVPVPVSGMEDVDGSWSYWAGEKEVKEEDIEQTEMGPVVMQPGPEKLVYEEVTCEPVRWDRFGWCTDCHYWPDMPYAYIIHDMTHAEVEEQFGGEVADEIEYNAKDAATKKSGAEKEGTAIQHYARIYEVFDKVNRKICYVSEFYPDKFIDSEEDPWDLEGFYPFPQPLFAINTSDNMIPVAYFIAAQDQYRALDRIQGRIDKQIEMIRVRGYYSGQFEELGDILGASDGTLVPVDNWADANQLQHDPLKLIPIDGVIQSLQVLIEMRRQLKEEIYEIYGFSDMLRGASKASETLGAQNIKAQYTGIRFSQPAKKIQRWVRSLIRLKGEMIAEHFQAETLEKISQKPVGEEHIALMRDQVVRSYVVDINTDSMLLENEQAELEARNATVQAIAQVATMMYEPTAAGIFPPELSKEVILFAVRGHRKARELEEALEAMTFAQPSVPPTPEDPGVAGGAAGPPAAGPDNSGPPQ